MIPDKPLPYPDCWGSTEEYVENLLEFATTSEIFQTLCGGVHILDFFTNEPGLYQLIVPLDWQSYLLQCEPMRLLDMLMRDDLDSLPDPRPPATFLQYIKDIRKYSFKREFLTKHEKLPKLTRQVAVGMKPKKVHEVSNFANYVHILAADIAAVSGEDITHFVDFGSGQNYLGRALASSPYNRHIVAVEGREHNIAGAKELDMLAGLAEKEKVMRNKKLWIQQLNSARPEGSINGKKVKKVAESTKASDDYVADFRSTKELQATYKPEDGKGFIRYVSGRLESGDLSDVIGQLQDVDDSLKQEVVDFRMMAVSIHSCGNLSHHGIRSLILNPDVRAVAIVGCCYNLMTEKLGPPSYKLPFMRPSLQAINGRVVRESARHDPQGFPMSERLSKYREAGVRFNITARMMACQAPHNWGKQDSDGFFTRHFYRAILQKIFLDKGVITKIYHDSSERPDGEVSPFNASTNPVIIGSLRKGCYNSLGSYVRGAITKLTTQSDYHEYCELIKEKLGGITDEEIARYEELYHHRKRELSAIWSLMAFSAGVVESMIVTDRWLFLTQHSDIVEKAWVEAVFDYRESPRNLVVVGMKKRAPQ